MKTRKQRRQRQTAKKSSFTQAQKRKHVKPRQRQTNKKSSFTQPRKRKRVEPRTAEELFAKTKRFQENWILTTSAVSKARDEDITIAKASRQIGADPRFVRQWARSALHKRKNGRYVAKASDRLLRVVKAVTKHRGLIDVATRDSRQASLAGRYWAAVERYQDTGDATRLTKFRRKHIIDANGKRVPLLTDLLELDRLASAGVLSFESLYARSR